jgi:putative endonuclease
MPRPGYVYILASRPHGTLYTGVTSDLAGRVEQHRAGIVKAFTRRHGIHRLVYAEYHTEIGDAIAREKQIKKWRRAWKIRLIEEKNAGWRDLSAELWP